MNGVISSQATANFNTLEKVKDEIGSLDLDNMTEEEAESAVKTMLSAKGYGDVNVKNFITSKQGQDGQQELNLNIEELATELDVDIADALSFVQGLENSGKLTGALAAYFSDDVSIQDDAEETFLLDLMMLDDPNLAEGARDEIMKNLDSLEKDEVITSEEKDSMVAMVDDLVENGQPTSVDAEPTAAFTIDGVSYPTSGTVEKEDESGIPYLATYNINEETGNFEVTTSDVDGANGYTKEFDSEGTLLSQTDSTGLTINYNSDGTIESGASVIDGVDYELDYVDGEFVFSDAVINGVSTAEMLADPGIIDLENSVNDALSQMVTAEDSEGNDQFIESFISGENIDAAASFLEGDIEDIVTALGQEAADAIATYQAIDNPTDADKQTLYDAICSGVQANYTYESDDVDGGGESYQSFSESLSEMLSGGLTGDCEDPDIFTANLLYALGFSTEEVSINVSVEGENGHSVLSFNGAEGTTYYDFSANNGAGGIIDSFDATFSYNKEGVIGDVDGPIMFTDEGLKTATLDTSYDTDGTDGFSSEEIQNAVAAIIEEYTTLDIDVGDNSVSGVINSVGSAISALYDGMKGIALAMVDHAEVFTSPGALFLVQTELQILKDGIAAITAVGKSVGDTLSEAVSGFASNVGRM